MTSRRHRVLFVGAFPPKGSSIIGGMVTSCRTLLDSQLPHKLELDLFDSTQISNPPPIFIRRLFLAIFRIFRFVRRLEQSKPDAVILFVASGASVLEKGAMARYARIRGVPVIMFPRAGSVVDSSEQSVLVRKLTQLAFSPAQRIVCQSEEWRKFANETLGKTAASVIVLRNWTASPALLAIGERRAGQSGTPVKLVFLGWLEFDKGIVELIDACAELTNSHEFTLDIVGDGRAADQVRSLIVEYGLENRVFLKGWLNSGQVQKVLAKADVLVLPSWAEGLPNAMVEAMAARLAIVATSVGAIPDVITHEVSGLLVEPRNSQILRDALSKIISEPALREEMAAQAYEIAARDFSVDAAAERIYNIVDELVA